MGGWFDDAQPGELDAAFPGHGFQHAAAGKTSVGAAFEHGHDAVVLGETEEFEVRVLVEVEADLPGEIVLEQEGGEGGAVHRRDVLALEVFQALDVLPVAAGEDHAAKAVDGDAVLALDQCGEARDAEARLHDDVVLGVGEHEIQLAVGECDLELGQRHRNGNEARAGHPRREVVHRRLPFADGDGLVAE